jgi:acetyl-CoA synthetase
VITVDKPIAKSAASLRLSPNLADYSTACAKFSWPQAMSELLGLPGGGLNIAFEAVDRHALGPLKDKVALRWLGKDGGRQDITYRELKNLTDRFANVLTSLGVAKGERVYTLTGRIPELYVAALGTLKNRSVFCPLYSAFGPEPIQTRLAIGQAKVLVTTESLYRRKVAPIRSELAHLDHVVLVGDERQPTDVPGTLDYQRLMEAV